MPLPLIRFQLKIRGTITQRKETEGGCCLASSQPQKTMITQRLVWTLAGDCDKDSPSYDQ